MAVEAAAIEVTLPAMGESVTEGTVLEWHKQEGDTIEPDEILVEISTDKVDAEVPSPAGGTVVKLLVAEGDTVEVGQALAEIATSNGAAPAAASSPEDSAPPADEAPAEESGGAEEILDIVTPAGGESVTEGTILERAVKVGDVVGDGDTIVEISTDKVDMELPAPAAGRITEIVAEEGETVTVGQVIARMAVGAGAAAEAKPAAPSEPAASGNGAASAPAAPAANGDANATPVAQRVAAAEGVDLANVAGSGPRGRITKADVLNGGGNGAARVGGIVSAAGERVALKGGAAMLAKYMDESRSIPTATSFRTMTVTVMDGRRKQL